MTAIATTGGQGRTLHRAYIVALAAMLLLAMPAAAHPPTDMVISFDQDTAKMSVTITHPVLNPATHYIRTVQVELNGRVISNPVYRSQPAKDTFTYMYDVNAHPGDTIRVTAACSLAGSLEKTYDVPGAVRTETATPGEPANGPDPTAMPGTTLPATTKASAGLLSLPGIAGAMVLIRKK